MFLRRMLLRSAFIGLMATMGACVTHAPAGSAPSAVSATLQGDAARPSLAQGWVRSELYFGVGEESGPTDRPQAEPISEAQWRAFLDKEVTPRFPEGLTVVRGAGRSNATT